jgi:hypothetical protein
MDIREWAKKQTAEAIETIKYYIQQGIPKEKAVDMVLSGSCLGAGYKAQINYEIKNYTV